MPQKCFSISCVNRTAAVLTVFSVFSGFLCVLCVNVLAFLCARCAPTSASSTLISCSSVFPILISVHLPSSVVPFLLLRFTPAAQPRTAPTAATFPRAPRKIPNPSKPWPPNPLQYPATPPAHAEPDKLPS